MRFVGMTAAAVLASSAALAAEPSGGMPQLDFSQPLVLAQVVWLFVIFGLLYAIMSSQALPRVASVLAERRARIDGDLDAALHAKTAADAAITAHREATGKARAEAQAAVTAAGQAAQVEAAAKIAALNARLDAEIRAAEQRIAVSRDSAMAALPEVATETAEALVRRLVGSADRAAIERAVGVALAERGRA